MSTASNNSSNAAETLHVASTETEARHGKPKAPYIPYGRQSISQEDIDAVIGVLQSDFLTQGPIVPRFENAFADYCEARHGIATNSATSALHIACLALGVGQGDCVWTSPITFVASANCARYCGADVDFVDIDPTTYNLCHIALAEKLQKARAQGSLPKALIAVHLAGQSCNMREIRKLADDYGFLVIEDASHAVGSRYENAPVGNCRYSDIAVFSFHPVKIMTTGEGGIALTNQTDLAENMRLLRSHGVTRDTAALEACTPQAWYYEQRDLGFNYRMTDIQAALGVSQLERLDDFLHQRRRVAHYYNTHLADLPIQLPSQATATRSSWHLYIIRLQIDNIARSHEAVFDRLRAAGIGVNLHYIPVHTQPYYRKMGFKTGQFPEAERYYAEAISLPIYPSLSVEQLDHICDTLRETLVA